MPVPDRFPGAHAMTVTAAVDSPHDSSYTPRYLDGLPVIYRTEVVTIRAEIAPILWKPTAGPRKTGSFAVNRVFVDARDVLEDEPGGAPHDETKKRDLN